MRIGIIGGGQLGLMLGEAGKALGIDCEFLDPSPQPPAAAAGPVTTAAFDNRDAILRLAARCDALTYEFENVPVSALEPLAHDYPVFPPPAALARAQDRMSEKELFESLDIALPGWHAVDSRDDLDAAAKKLGLPLVLKTRRLGYDGKGQAVVRGADDLDHAWNSLSGSPLIAEAFVPFDFEVSAIATRSLSGSIERYPLTHNIHEGGILRYSRAPVVSPELDAQADVAIRRMLEELDYVGTLALELFVSDGRLLANEFAPRVHNSGHWTIEGAETSQFANHLVAVAGDEPRPAGVAQHAGMLNLIGEIPAAAREIDRPGTTLHDYGKSARPGRKLGHITIVANTALERDRMLREIGDSVTGSTPDFGTAL